MRKMLLENVKRKQHANIRLKSDFKFIKPTDNEGKEGAGSGVCFVHRSVGSNTGASGTNKALKENVLNSLFTYF